MIAVIFEVEPGEGLRDDYLDVAAEIRPVLEQVEGFISVERFQSLVNPGKILSLSFFESEEAVQDWRNREEHRAAQAKGRTALFDGYRIRVAQVLRDYTLDQRRDQVPEDSRKVHSA